jgi:hypothetical protein
MVNKLLTNPLSGILSSKLNPKPIKPSGLSSGASSTTKTTATAAIAIAGATKTDSPYTINTTSSTTVNANTNTKGPCGYIPPATVEPGSYSCDEPRDNDVLCGRGSRVNNHKGNVEFRVLVSQFKDLYLAESRRKTEKSHICAYVVSLVREQAAPNGGRFLKYCPKSKQWEEVGDIKARKKAGQALREDATELRATAAVAVAVAGQNIMLQMKVNPQTKQKQTQQQKQKTKTIITTKKEGKGVGGGGDDTGGGGPQNGATVNADANVNVFHPRVIVDSGGADAASTSTPTKKMKKQSQSQQQETEEEHHNNSSSIVDNNHDDDDDGDGDGDLSMEEHELLRASVESFRVSGEEGVDKWNGNAGCGSSDSNGNCAIPIHMIDFAQFLKEGDRGDMLMQAQQQHNSQHDSHHRHANDHPMNRSTTTLPAGNLSNVLHERERDLVHDTGNNARKQKGTSSSSGHSLFQNMPHSFSASDNSINTRRPKKERLCTHPHPDVDVDVHVDPTGTTHNSAATRQHDYLNVNVKARAASAVAGSSTTNNISSAAPRQHDYLNVKARPASVRETLLPFEDPFQPALLLAHQSLDTTGSYTAPALGAGASLFQNNHPHPYNNNQTTQPPLPFAAPSLSVVQAQQSHAQPQQIQAPMLPASVLPFYNRHMHNSRGNGNVATTNHSNIMLLQRDVSSSDDDPSGMSMMFDSVGSFNPTGSVSTSLHGSMNMNRMSSTMGGNGNGSGIYNIGRGGGIDFSQFLSQADKAEMYGHGGGAYRDGNRDGYRDRDSDGGNDALVASTAFHAARQLHRHRQRFDSVLDELALGHEHEQEHDHQIRSVVSLSNTSSAGLLLDNSTMNTTNRHNQSHITQHHPGTAIATTAAAACSNHTHVNVNGQHNHYDHDYAGLRDSFGMMAMMADSTRSTST